MLFSIRRQTSLTLRHTQQQGSGRLYVLRGLPLPKPPHKTLEIKTHHHKKSFISMVHEDFACNHPKNVPHKYLSMHRGNKGDTFFVFLLYKPYHPDALSWSLFVVPSTLRVWLRPQAFACPVPCVWDALPSDVPLLVSLLYLSEVFAYRLPPQTVLAGQLISSCTSTHIPHLNPYHHSLVTCFL